MSEIKFTVDDLVSQSYEKNEAKLSRMRKIAKKASELAKDPGFPDGINAVTIIPMVLLNGNIAQIMEYEMQKHGRRYADPQELELIKQAMDQFLPLFQ